MIILLLSWEFSLSSAIPSGYFSQNTQSGVSFSLVYEKYLDFGINFVNFSKEGYNLFIYKFEIGYPLKKDFLHIVPSVSLNYCVREGRYGGKENGFYPDVGIRFKFLIRTKPYIFLNLKFEEVFNGSIGSDITYFGIGFGM